MTHRKAINLAVGSKIKQLRLDLALTQEQLAERANSHPNYIGAIERGEKSPSVVKLVEISIALNCMVSDLVSGEPFPGY